MMSGRPLYVNPQINASDAFVAAWLPGSEGQGVADVLLAKADGSPQYDFQGRLSFSWPKRPDQTPLNIGDANYDPQFPYGFGLTYAKPAQTAQLAEAAGNVKYGEKNVYYAKGDVWNGYKLFIGDASVARRADVGSKTTLYGSEAIVLRPTDNGVRVVWAGRKNAWFEVAADRTTDIAREANGAMMLSVKLKVNAVPTGNVAMGVGGSSVPVSKLLKPGDVTLTVPLSCFRNSQDLAKTPSVLHLATSGTLDISVYDVRLIETKTGAACPID
jgi:beta-glucosidase